METRTIQTDATYSSCLTYCERQGYRYTGLQVLYIMSYILSEAGLQIHWTTGIIHNVLHTVRGRVTHTPDYRYYT